MIKNVAALYGAKRTRPGWPIERPCPRCSTIQLDHLIRGRQEPKRMLTFFT